MEYLSGGNRLWGWFAMPAATTRSGERPVPAMLYLHGGWAFGAQDFEDARPFLDAGFALFVPTLRGENGNSGEFEMAYGELDDAVAAVTFLAAQPGIDRTRIAAFGHSSGGMLASLLTLVPEVPLVLTGSAGGIYSDGDLQGFGEMAPFAVENPTERQFRTLIAHLPEMRRPHVAFVGQRDSLARSAVISQRNAIATRAELTVEFIAGDHFTSLSPAVVAFARRALAAMPEQQDR